MTVTIAGTLMRRHGFSMDIGERFGAVLDVHSYDTERLTVADHVGIDLDHDDREIGHLVHVERTDQGDIHCVGVIEGNDDLADLDGDIFLSPCLLCRQSGSDRAWIGKDPHLLSVALTRSPQQICMYPITILPGDVTSSYARSCWPWKQSTRPLLKRAIEATSTIEMRRAPLGLVDLRPSTITAVPILTAPSRLELRSAATGDVHRAGRTIELVAIPHEVETVVVHDGRAVGEVCTRGAFAGEERTSRRIPVNRDHDATRLVGKVDRLDPYDTRGVIAELRIARTVLGDETLALAADGILDASVGFAIPTGGESWDSGRTRRRINKAFLDHIALTAQPAYETASVLAVRSHR